MGSLLSSLRWDQIQGPANNGASESVRNTAFLLDKALGNMRGAIGDFRGEQQDMAAANLLGNLQKYGTAEEAHLALANGSALANIDPSHMTSGARKMAMDQIISANSVDTAKKGREVSDHNMKISDQEMGLRRQELAIKQAAAARSAANAASKSKLDELLYAEAVRRNAMGEREFKDWEHGVAVKDIRNNLANASQDDLINLTKAGWNDPTNPQFQAAYSLLSDENKARFEQYDIRDLSEGQEAFLNSSKDQEFAAAAQRKLAEEEAIKAKTFEQGNTSLQHLDKLRVLGDQVNRWQESSSGKTNSTNPLDVTPNSIATRSGGSLYPQGLNNFAYAPAGNYGNTLGANKEFSVGNILNKDIASMLNNLTLSKEEKESILKGVKDGSISGDDLTNMLTQKFVEQARSAYAASAEPSQISTENGLMDVTKRVIDNDPNSIQNIAAHISSPNESNALMDMIDDNLFAANRRFLPSIGDIETFGSKERTAADTDKLLSEVGVSKPLQMELIRRISDETGASAEEARSILVHNIREGGWLTGDNINDAALGKTIKHINDMGIQNIRRRTKETESIKVEIESLREAANKIQRQKAAIMNSVIYSPKEKQALTTKLDKEAQYLASKYSKLANKVKKL